MNPVNRKADESLSEFQRALVQLLMPFSVQSSSISYIRVSHVDTISSLYDSEKGVISFSEVHELLTKIHDILDSAMLVTQLIFLAHF